MDKLFTSAAWGWFGRRILDWGGWIGTFVTVAFGLYNSLPPIAQDALLKLIQGKWQGVTLGAIVPIAVLVWSQIMSFRATVKPQIVTSDGIKAPLKEVAPTTRETIETVATNAAERQRNPFAEFFRRMFGK